jgi:hypothetical protein
MKRPPMPWKADRWAAGKLRNLLSRNATKASALYHQLNRREVTAITHAIRRLEGRLP